MPGLVDIAHRVTVTGLAGMGIWGLWLTGAVWKSRRDERALLLMANNPDSLKTDANPVTNDPAHETNRRV